MSEITNPEDIKKAPAVEVETRRVKLLLVRSEHFMAFFTKGMVFRKHAKVIEGVPADAKIMGIGANPVYPGVLLVVESEEYDEIPVTQNPPVQQITIDLGRNVSTKKTTKRKK